MNFISKMEAAGSVLQKLSREMVRNWVNDERQIQWGDMTFSKGRIEKGWLKQQDRRVFVSQKQTFPLRPILPTSRGDEAVPGALPHLDGAARMSNYVGCFQRKVRACFLSFANCMTAREALWFWCECFRVEKKIPFMLVQNAGIQRHLPHQDNLFFLPVIPIEQTTLTDNATHWFKCVKVLLNWMLSTQLNALLKLDVSISASLWLTWGHSKRCRSSQSIIAMTEQIFLLQTAVGSAPFPLSAKQSHAESQFTAVFKEERIRYRICNLANQYFSSGNKIQFKLKSIN